MSNMRCLKKIAKPGRGCKQSMHYGMQRSQMGTLMINSKQLIFDPRIILLVTQVIIESLPISSSGHLRIAEMLLARAGVALGALPAFFEHFLDFTTPGLLGGC